MAQPKGETGNGPPRWDCGEVKNGSLDTPSTLDLWVIAPGHRVAAVDAISEPCTIALERAESTSLRVELSQSSRMGQLFVVAAEADTSRRGPVGRSGRSGFGLNSK